MLEEQNHSGYIKINPECEIDSPCDNTAKSKKPITPNYYAYDFRYGQIIIHGQDGISLLNGSKVIIGTGYNNTTYLFFLSTPINILYDFIDYSQEVDFVVKSYGFCSTYSSVRFSFDELSYFYPATSIIKTVSNNKVVVEKDDASISSFNIRIDDTLCQVDLCFDIEKEMSMIPPMIIAKTIIKISFPSTDDFGFLKKLYLIVDSAFSFLCNRRNTKCLSMQLSGEYPIKSIKGDRIIPCESEVFFFDKYRENAEDQKTIRKVQEVYFMADHLDKLFQIIAQDFSDDEANNGQISISSIHPSTQKRKLIDLQQTLHITAAFEFYVRKYLPSMIVEKEHHIKMREYLEDIVNKSNDSNRKLKKLAKSLMRFITIESLKEKVLNVYEGYDEWDGLKSCISEEWYKKEEIEELAKEINNWRNELAHENRLYTPTIKTIRAVRLLEHMNYAIVLRQIGCTDEEICLFLEKVLIRHFDPED